MGRPPDLSLEQQDLDEARPHRLVWADGSTVHLKGWEDEKILACDRAAAELAKIGIHLNVQPTAEDHYEPSLIPRRRRFTFARVPLSSVETWLIGDPGHEASYYAEAIYRTDPWTDLAKEMARRRFLVAAKRLGDRCSTVPVGGRTLYGPRGWRPGAAPPSTAPLPRGRMEALLTIAPMVGGDVPLAERIYIACQRLIEGGAS